MKFKIFKYKNVTSTNDVAMNLIKEDKIERGCVFAELQTRGRGTMGKKWISEIGNLFISIFFPLNKNYPPFDEFFIINPIIVSGVIKKICGKNEISIKWPNDVFINRKKVCGILQEIITVSDKRFLIVGIGINILSNPDIKSNYKATNILSETRKKPQIDKVIKLLADSYEKFFYDLKEYNYINFKNIAEKMTETSKI